MFDVSGSRLFSPRAAAKFTMVEENFFLASTSEMAAVFWDRERIYSDKSDVVGVTVSNQNRLERDRDEGGR